MAIRMNQISCAVAIALAGFTIVPQKSFAQENPNIETTSQVEEKLDCTQAQCVSNEGVLFKIKSQGELDPVTDSQAKTVTALAPDRRTTVQAEDPGKAVVVGKWSVQLPNGGVIWATEDPGLGQPQYSVSAPSLVAFENNKIVKPVSFYTFNNYSGFIQRAEILVFRAIDVDLISPIATIPLQAGEVSETLWDGELADNLNLRQGDELVYIVRAYDANGAFDETYPSRMQLVKPEVEQRGIQLIRDNASKKTGESIGVDEAVRLSQLIMFLVKINYANKIFLFMVLVFVFKVVIFLNRAM